MREGLTFCGAPTGIRLMRISTGCLLSQYSATFYDIKGRTIRYLGRGARVFVDWKLFFHLRKKTIFFLAMNVRQTFSYVSLKNWNILLLSYVFLLCTLPFADVSGQHIFLLISTTNFFSAHIFNNLFSNFCGDKLLFHIFPSLLTLTTLKYFL